MESRKVHWENIYRHKQPGEVSWTQEMPAVSLSMIESCNLPKTGSIIDIGGGDSKLVDHLLAAGYENITVLDISERALDRAKIRLGAAAEKVTWIVSDILAFYPGKQYDLWHDRAAFHFFTAPGDISAYLDIASRAVKEYLIIGTFSDEGPGKCSGLPVRKYAEPELENLLGDNFKKINGIREDHCTPFNTLQNFLFCRFRRIKMER